MKRTMGLGCLLVGLGMLIGCGGGGDGSLGQSGQELAASSPATASAASGEGGGLRHDYARADERECPSPACGGYWLVSPSFHNACHDQSSSTYVAGIYAGDQEISPPCDQLLTGTLKPDPRDPRYDVFLLEL